MKALLNPNRSLGRFYIVFCNCLQSFVFNPKSKQALTTDLGLIQKIEQALMTDLGLISLSISLPALIRGVGC